MPYAFYHNHTFTLIDSTPKNGVFCQLFSSSYSPKPIPIQTKHTTDYSAYMDEDGTLYVATMPDAFHLNYYVLDNNRFNKNTLISNMNSHYNLSSPMIYTLNHIPFLVYLSHQTHSNAYNFVCENLMHPQLVTLLTTYELPEQIKYFTSPSGLYIFYITFDETYHLNALYITPNATKVLTFVESMQPITDYSICLDGDRIHIVYVAELHGKYQLFYYHTPSGTFIPLATTQSPSCPVVFYYYHALWINAMIDRKLHMYISMDGGQHFSLPVPCSLQNNVYRCDFQSLMPTSLVAHQLYASIGSTFKLCVIAMADIHNFHNDTVISPEIELILEGLILASNQVPLAAAPSPPVLPQMPTPMPRNRVSSTPDPSESAPASVTQAKSLFVEQGLNSWDLPPRI